MKGEQHCVSLSKGIDVSHSIDQIRDDFSYLDDWEDRYRYVIELGKDLTPLSEDEKNSDNKVQGCVSQVWLVTEKSGDPEPVLTFRGESDAHIVNGLVAIMLATYSGQSASTIQKTDGEAILASLGLDAHLTPQRANGVRSMIKRIQADAAQSAP